MTTLFLDIETIPTQRDAVSDYLSAQLREQIEADMQAVCAPSNYKDPEKIAAYCAEKKKELQDAFAQKLADKINATGLDGSFGQVFCIGWACDGEAPQTIYGMKEKPVLEEFGQAMKKAVHLNELFSSTVVGHNVSAFDLRFLTQRFIVNGIRPPLVITRGAQAKPWESDKVYDTMVQWAGVGGKIGLDKLCMALSIPSPKNGMDGSMVWPMVQEEKFEEVSDYCKRDVEAVREVWRRMTFASVTQPLEAVAA